MKIAQVVCEPIRSGFYRDDQAAIRAGATTNGFDYEGEVLTEGFSAIREAGVAVSIMLVLADGQIALGDCAEVQYSGAGGRAPAMTIELVLKEIRESVAPALIGRDVNEFRSLAEEIDTAEFGGERLSAPTRYGVTQALLHATSLATAVTMAEVVQREYLIQRPIARVPIFTQSGDDRHLSVDKMIIKEADVLPHALINEVSTKLGDNGEILLDYVLWLRDRLISSRRRPDYEPRLHIDTYGTIGIAFAGDLDRIISYLGALAAAAAPFQLRIEHPIDAGSRDAQVVLYRQLREGLAAASIPVELSVDEWCNTLEDIEVFVSAKAADVIHVKTPDLGGINNTIEAMLLVNAHGLAAYCGGTCNETDVSARVSTQIAMACGADQVLAKPGMGVDEGLMIVGNEMTRTLALVANRQLSEGKATHETA